MSLIHAHVYLTQTRLYVAGLAETATEARDLAALQARKLNAAQLAAAQKADIEAAESGDDDDGGNEKNLRKVWEEVDLQAALASADESTPHQSAKLAMANAIATIRGRDDKAPEPDESNVGSVAASENLSKALRRLEMEADVDDLEAPPDPRDDDDDDDTETPSDDAPDDPPAGDSGDGESGSDESEEPQNG